MGWQIQFDVSNKILLVRLEGQLTDEAALECYEAVEAYALEKNISAGIVDLSAASGFPVSAHLVRQLARRQPRVPGDVPRVIVAPHVVAYGLNFHVVRNLEHALKLLHVQSSEFHSLV